MHEDEIVHMNIVPVMRESILDHFLGHLLHFRLTFADASLFNCIADNRHVIFVIHSLCVACFRSSSQIKSKQPTNSFDSNRSCVTAFECFVCADASKICQPWHIRRKHSHHQPEDLQFLIQLL